METDVRYVGLGFGTGKIVIAGGMVLQNRTLYGLGVKNENYMAWFWFGFYFQEFPK